MCIKGVPILPPRNTLLPSASNILEISVAVVVFPIILIAGGRDKGTSFDILKNAIKKKVKLVILIGESRFRIQKEIGGEVKTEIASSLEDAITKTVKNLEAGDTVLFSPACTSFDMFNSYEERGIRFKQIVNEL